MNARRIIALMKSSAEPGAGASADCLSPERLAAYQDGVLHGGERADAEAHFADCDRCLYQLAALGRAAATGDAEYGVPATLVARARGLYTPPAKEPPPPRWRWTVPLAAAAVLLLSISVALIPSPGTNAEPEAAIAPQTRRAGHELLQPRLLAPAEGSVVQPAEQVFRWTEVPGTQFYDVRLVSLDGDLLLRERVDSTRWLIPGSLQLEPGEEYYVRVDAWLNDAKYLSSEYRVFRVAGVQ